MQAHERLSAAIRAANDKGQTALVPFITAGYPEPRRIHRDAEGDRRGRRRGRTWHTVLRPDGRRHDDPALEFRRAAKRCQPEVDLRCSSIAPARSTRRWCMMSYLNPLLAFGYDKLARRARGSRCLRLHRARPAVRGERRDLRAALEAEGVGLIQLVTPATPDARLEMLADASQGFRLRGHDHRHHGRRRGLAGRPRGVSRQGCRPCRRCRCVPASAFARPSDVANVGAHAAGAIVGSALVEVLEKNGDPAAYLCSPCEPENEEARFRRVADHGQSLEEHARERGHPVRDSQPASRFDHGRGAVLRGLAATVGRERPRPTIARNN